MSQLAVEQLTPMEKQELLCVYSSLLLYDDGFDITKENIKKVLDSAGAKVEPYLPMLFARALKGKDLNGGAVAGSAVAAAPGASAPSAADDKAQDSNHEEEEEEDDDMGFSLFD